MSELIQAWWQIHVSELDNQWPILLEKLNQV